MENRYYIKNKFILYGYPENRDGRIILQFFDEKEGIRILEILNESIHLNHL